MAAKLGVARCAESLGQLKEAIQLYEELVPAVAGTQWAVPVAIRLDVLARSQETVTNEAKQPSLTLPGMIK